MASTYIKLNTHIVFHIKSNSCKINNNDLPKIFAYIGGIINGFGETPIIIGGMNDHVHILCTLPKTVSIADYVRTIKAKSSKWIKSIDTYYDKFAWQEGYGAFSVSPSSMNKTISYIQGQAEHHKKRTFKEEYKLFLDEYGINLDEKEEFGG